ncbi:MAG: class E sortase [Candidatus Aquicultor sp.]|nr:class E sortase [Candidatus Aquicultor sp.]
MKKERSKDTLNKVANLMLAVGLICLVVPTGLWLNAKYYQWHEVKKWQPVARVSADSDRSVSDNAKDGNYSMSVSSDGSATAGDIADLVAGGPGKTGKSIAFIVIPKLDLSLSFIEGESWSYLAKGPARVSKTAQIGAVGTSLISGHRTMYAAPFHDLDKLDIADRVYVYTEQALFVYTVAGIKRVKPDDWSDIKSDGERRLVLSTCDPMYSAAKRLLIIAHLSEAQKLDGAN